MRTTIQDLNSLRGIVRKLQEENETLKKLLEDNGIEYESEEIIDVKDVKQFKIPLSLSFWNTVKDAWI